MIVLETFNVTNRVRCDFMKFHSLLLVERFLLTRFIYYLLDISEIRDNIVTVFLKVVTPSKSPQRVRTVCFSSRYSECSHLISNVTVFSLSTGRGGQGSR